MSARDTFALARSTGATAASVARRLLPPARRMEQLPTMDEVPGVELVDVTLPRDPAPPPTSRSLQPDLHPMFTRAYSRPRYPLRVASLPGGRLLSSGGVATADGRLVLESLWDADHFKRDFDPPDRLPRPTRLRGAHASLISLWGDNYFHWIFNCLPRLAVLQASGVPYDGLIVPERLAPFQREQLELLGIPEDRLVPFSGRNVQADTLVWAAPLAPINEPSRYLLDWVRRALCPQQPEPHRRLYVTRRGTRMAVNERELFAALEPLGFEFLLPESLPFREQVDVFAATRMAVGPHGSNFVNGIFSRRLSVLELFQPAHVNWGVYSVLCAAGQDHWNIICPPVKRRGPRRFDDMLVPIDLVLETIDQMEREVET